VPVQGCTLPYLSACTRVHFTLHQCLYKGALYLLPLFLYTISGFNNGANEIFVLLGCYFA